MKKTLSILICCLALHACSNNDNSNDTLTVPVIDPPMPAAASRVVVAVVDSSFNAYHEFFYTGSPIYGNAAPASVTADVLAEFGVPPENQIELTRSGDLVADIATDGAFWDTVQRGQPYWFKGTNLIAVSFCEEAFTPLVPDTAKNPHGTGTSAAVLRANPEAVLLLVEACTTPETPELEFAGTHPAVDLLSYSFSIGFGVPVSYAASYRAVVELGKLQFHAAGNLPNPTPIQGGPGQWWVIGVSGFEEGGSEGQTLLASNLPDFVSDYTDELPFCMDCEQGLVQVGGTSLSAPRAAGVASRVLLEARRSSGHLGGIHLQDGQPPALVAAGANTITNWDLRRALEQAAYVDYDLFSYTPGQDSSPLPIGSLPINNLAPWLQLGWGDLSADPAKAVVSETLTHLGFGNPTRTKASGYCSFQSINLRLRQSYWDTIDSARGLGEVVPDPNPYRFCDGA